MRPRCWPRGREGDWGRCSRLRWALCQHTPIIRVPLISCMRDSRYPWMSFEMNQGACAAGAGADALSLFLAHSQGRKAKLYLAILGWWLRATVRHKCVFKKVFKSGDGALPRIERGKIFRDNFHLFFILYFM
jgi:hypothetical protein